MNIETAIASLLIAETTIIFCSINLCVCLLSYVWLFKFFCVSIRNNIICSNLAKNGIGILIWNALKPQSILSSIIILTILNLPIHEYGMSFYLFVSSLIFFHQCFVICSYKSLISLIKFLPKSFLMLSGIVS